MSEKLEELLAIKENELLSLCSNMQKIKLEFIDVTSDFVAKWYEETAKKYITKYAEVSLNLSTQRFGELKAKVSRLVAKSRGLSERGLSQTGAWWHEKPELHTEVTRYDHLGNQQVGDKYPEVIDTPVRIVLGELGIILEEFGYNIRTTVPHGPCPQEYWFQKFEDRTISPYFPHVLEWSKSMQDTLQEYNLLYKQGQVILQEIQRIKDEIKRCKIINLWNSMP